MKADGVDARAPIADSPVRQAFVEELRHILDATVLTSVDDARLTALLRQLAPIRQALEDDRQDSPWFWRVRPDGGGSAWGRYNPAAPPVALGIAGDGVRGTVTVGTAFGGPPGLVHGGVVATILDQAMGACLAAFERPSLTATITVDYRRGTPLHQELTVEAGFRPGQGRKTTAWATVGTADGVVTAEATGVFIAVRR
jgi:acyl-coenzyme A thioesterase PaaI-like protein